MDFLLLGPFEVRDGDHIVPLPRKKHRALLALLVCWLVVSRLAIRALRRALVPRHVTLAEGTPS